MKSSQPGTNIGTPIKIEDPNQFVPLNTDPTEVLDKRNRVSRVHILFSFFWPVGVRLFLFQVLFLLVFLQGDPQNSV